MKPIAVFRHARSEGPGYFATFMEARAVDLRIIAVDAGEPLPGQARAFSGLVFMGGPMSVNDPLPWIDPALALIRDAVMSDVPVLGHCLGAQLMSRALGGVVTRAPVKEIGWGRVGVTDNGLAATWFGDMTEFEAFHWHGEAFSIPPGGTRLLENEHCANQGFVLGRHVGLQCHVEMTAEMVGRWCDVGREEIGASTSPAVQPVEDICRDLDPRVGALHRAADRIYARWLDGVRRT